MVVLYMLTFVMAGIDKVHGRIIAIRINANGVDGGLVCGESGGTGVKGKREEIEEEEEVKGGERRGDLRGL